MITKAPKKKQAICWEFFELICIESKSTQNQIESNQKSNRIEIESNQNRIESNSNRIKIESNQTRIESNRIKIESNQNRIEPKSNRIESNQNRIKSKSKSNRIQSNRLRTLVSPPPQKKTWGFFSSRNLVPTWSQLSRPIISGHYTFVEYGLPMTLTNDYRF